MGVVGGGLLWHEVDWEFGWLGTSLLGAGGSGGVSRWCSGLVVQLEAFTWAEAYSTYWAASSRCLWFATLGCHVPLPAHTAIPCIPPRHLC